jgi:hypothetical protein
MPIRKSSSFCALLQGKKHELMTRNETSVHDMPKPTVSSNKEIQSTISNEDQGKRFWYPKIVLLADFLDRGDIETGKRYT